MGSPRDDAEDHRRIGPPSGSPASRALLRDNGFKVGLAETRDALAILASPAAARPSSLKPALRALFCATRSDWEKFDEIFRGVLARARHAPRAKPDRAAPSGKASAAAPGRGRRRTRRCGPARSRRSAERRRRRRGRWARPARRRLAAPKTSPPPTCATSPIPPMSRAPTRSRRGSRARMRARLVRREQVRRRGRRLDLRRTIHRNVSHGGTPIDLAWRRRKIKPLRLVVLLDASGSMELYTAFFVRFLHGVVDAFREAEAFVFHTRLAHVSASLRDRDVARAVDRLGLMAQGIGGGTRIGESLATFNRWHARRVINSRTAVMIVSDGYDTGEPERLGAEMRRLRRRCRRIIWLNPLIGWRDYSAAGARHAGGAALCRPVRAGAQPREPCGARAVSREDLIMSDHATDILDTISDAEGPGRAVRAGDGRAHCRGDGREGRRQGGDPARRHHVRRLDRRRLRARRGAQGRARGARRRQAAARLGAAARCAAGPGRPGGRGARRACASPRTCARARARWTSSSSRCCRARRS